MDETFIKDLRLKGIIGVYDWERKIEQDILINVRCFSEKRINRSDELNDCIDYENLANLIITKVKSVARFTIEALAEDIADVSLAINGIEKVIVRVEKPGALEEISSVGVQIEREQEIN